MPKAAKLIIGLLLDPMLMLLNVMQAAPVIIVGSHVWVEDPHLAWIDGQVTRIDGQNIHVRTKKGKTVRFQLFCFLFLLVSTRSYCMWVKSIKSCWNN